MMELRVVPDVLSDRPGVRVSPEASVLEAARQMRDLEVAAAVVVGSDETMAGLVTERDITRRLAAEGLDAKTTPVSEVMRTDVDHLNPEDLALDVVDLMDIRDVECLPVIENGELIGLVTMNDLCDVLRREMELMTKAANQTALGATDDL